MTKEEFIQFDERIARKKSEALWKDGVSQEWLCFSRLKNQDGKCTILSFFSDGPIIFIDRKEHAAGQVISECYFCTETSFQVEQISNRAIAVEAFRMFSAGVGIDLIKQHFSCNRKAGISAVMLSELTRYQLNKKMEQQFRVRKSSKKEETPLGI